MTLTTDVTPLRRLPVPDPQPPFDDEPPLSLVPAAATSSPAAATGPAEDVQLTLALSIPGERPPRQLVPAARGRHQTRQFVPRPPRSAPATPLPPVRPWAGRLVQAVMEVLAGSRPLPQLMRWTSAPVYDDLTTLTESPRATDPDARAPRSSAAKRRAQQGPAFVRSVHVTQPEHDIAEVAAVVSRAGRSRAVALRLEGANGRWRCTALQLG